MKSIMQEASSIAKAVEQGWLKAGSPVDFSVKILEEPKKNFFGLTTQPAKVAIFFDEKRPAQAMRQEEKPRRPNTRIESRDVLQPRDSREQRESRVAREPRERHMPRRQERPQQERPERVSHERTSERRADVSVEPSVRQPLEAQWNEAMIAYANDWMKQILQGVQRDTISFSIEPNNVYLRITLNEAIMDSSEKEKRMLASLALLLLEALKRHFKVGLRRHKIILTHAAGQNPPV